nr:immunoglobulin heavy chain junction region [Macaca mulatta]MOW19264.1 immunoglobulin heavy chain junction region [Macaca mulatta]MOW19322.1 immunoglobulin heavy chain junction region [Macaca mulatta]MOW19346.1 immunoglobulin heavy chain junction region [Macaca mulatta]MOW19424.1 immunoglobulin heavy chain junction region [Macaca mulatta]
CAKDQSLVQWVPTFDYW